MWSIWCGKGKSFIQSSFPISVLKILGKGVVVRYRVIGNTDTKNVWVFLGVQLLCCPWLTYFYSFSKTYISDVSGVLISLRFLLALSMLVGAGQGYGAHKCPTGHCPVIFHGLRWTQKKLKDIGSLGKISTGLWAGEKPQRRPGLPAAWVKFIKSFFCIKIQRMVQNSRYFYTNFWSF